MRKIAPIWRNYLFLPVFVLGILGYLIYIKETDWKRATIYLSIMFLICVPIIIYVIINTLDLNQIKIFGITIPRMISNSYDIHQYGLSPIATQIW